MQMDMDTEKIRYMSESSNASTSGYSTMSPNAQLGSGFSPASSTYSSPVPSPRTATLPGEFSNMHLPTNSPLYQQQMPQTQYTQLQSVGQPQMVYASGRTYMDLGGNNMGDNIPMVTVPMHSGVGMGTFDVTGMFSNGNMMGNGSGGMGATISTGLVVPKKECSTIAELEILEQPVEKFRFRYKSEMHGTHGSLNGASSKRTPKTFPEVKLKNFEGRAVIRCSLFQWNLHSPHSHLLVVRKDDNDLIDPHEVQVSPKDGYVATFQNMGIIHTAKKNIFEELLKKKTDRLKFTTGRESLSTKQDHVLRKETEKEAKDMDLNKLRLCFEAYKIEDDNTFTLIAGPLYSNPINNRKSAQTGELRICRLSHSSGSVHGGEDLILLVEKVNKKNIKVRFFEKNEDDETVWEEYGKFRESDVHHQYAIVCQTPPYRNKDIDKEVEVYVELVRPTDDERSDPPRQFRYKPREVITSRKRRRTNSSAHNSFSSGSSLSSVELPKTVQEQTANLATGVITNSTFGIDFNKSEELKQILGSDIYKTMIENNSDELSKYCENDFELGALQTDGVASTSAVSVPQAKLLSVLSANGLNLHVLKIIKIYDEFVRTKKSGKSTIDQQTLANIITDIYNDYAEKNENGETIVHEIITNDNHKYGIKLCHILKFFNITDLLNRVLNMQNESVLHCACLHDRCHYIRPLLSLGCDPNIKDQHGNTALHVAIREQHLNCAESFLNMNKSAAPDGIRMNLSITNDDGLTPLHLAIKLHNEDIAERLVEYDGSVAEVANIKDGNTALHMAVQERSLRLIKAIMNTATKDVLLHTKNAAGYTPIDFARQVGHKIWEYLRSFVNDADFNVVIKEEEMSSSSFTDDEEESSDQSVALELVKIKKEEKQCESDSDTSSNTLASDSGSAENILRLLDDKEQFQALVTLLNEQERWKLLAENLKYNHLICLWSNAEDMLLHLRRKMESVQYAAFASALRQVIGNEQAAKFLQINNVTI